MPRRSHTVGVIGLGYGRAHIPAFHANGCQVVAVCQRDGAAARAVAERYGVPHAFERWEELIERARPDIVAIATPPVLHLEIARAAFASGAHVLCEKPLAMTAAEAREMVRAAAAAGRVGMTSFNWRYTAAMQRFHQMATDGHVGRLLHLRGDWLGARWAEETAPVTWRMDRATAGHGAMGDMGVHLIDLVRWSFGEFRRVVSLSGIAHPEAGAPGGRPRSAEDYCAVLAELASGAEVTLQASRAARGGNGHTVQAFGTAGALAYAMDRGAPRWFRGELRATGADGALQPVKVATGLPRSAAEGDASEVVGKTTIAPLVKRFLGAVAKGEAVSPSFEDGLRAQTVLDAVLESQARPGWATVAEA